MSASMVPTVGPAGEGALTFGDGRIGTRVRTYRKRLGLSQEVLAHRLGKSRRWLQKVEAGELFVEKLHDIIELADVLQVQPAELVDRPVPIIANGGHGQAWVAPLRDVLMPVPYRKRIAVSGDPAAVRADFETACRLHQRRQYPELAELLTRLVSGCEAWWAQAAGEEADAASWLLINTYCMTSALCQRIGDVGLAWVALTLADRVADQLALPLQQAVVARRVVNLLFYDGRYAEAGDGAMAAAETLASTPESPEQLSARGFLILKGAVAAARQDDGARAWRLLGEAGRVAGRLAEDADHMWTAFGPANVELHGLDLALNLGDPRSALRRADVLDPRRLAVAERRGRYWMDVARAQAADPVRNDAAAVSALLEAEHIDPWEVHHQAMVRALVRVLLERKRRSATPGLQGLAQRLGILATV
jgi:transcriptional regulator with XRE-family HTH domain